MELQGTGLINLAFNHWLKKNGFKARVRGIDTDFYWYHDNTISYSLFFADRFIPAWNKTLEELGCQYDIDVFYSAFLHELGHSQSYFSFSADERNQYEEDLDTLDKMAEFDMVDTNKDYIHLPIEYAATSWAVNFINQHPDLVEELVRLVGKAVALFYKINNVVDD